MLWKEEGAGEGDGGGEAVGVAYLPLLGTEECGGGTAGASGGGGRGSGREGRVLGGCQTSVAAETPPVSLSASVLSR